MFQYYSIDAIRSDLLKEGGAVLKSKGQNFLIDKNVINAMTELVAKAIPSYTDRTIIEIGPGLGALTHRLTEFADVIAIEIDPVLCKLLRAQFAGTKPQLTLIEGDARHHLKHLQAGIVCGNLPYYITSELILESIAIEKAGEFFFLVQSEFAERAGRADSQSAMSVYLGNFVSTNIVRQVSASCFYPKPKVESSYIHLKRHQPKSPGAVLSQILQMSYLSKRKKIRNSWRLARPADHRVTAELLEDTALSIGFALEKRAEEIEPAAFYQLATSIGNIIQQG